MAIYRLGTRKSLLATTQSRMVKARLEKDGVACELVEVDSHGDADRRTPLYEIEPESPGLFTKALEQALLRSEIDLAVHSLKDLPTEQPPELLLACIPERVDTADILLVREGSFTRGAPLGLRPGATVGSSSLRREAQLLDARPDLVIAPIRGNVPTRAAKVQAGELDAVVLAAAGLERLRLETPGLVRERLAFVPAPGQGALGVETRRDAPPELLLALARLHDRDAELETRIERRILRGLHGGCTLPLGVRCRARDKRIHLEAFLGLARDRKAPKREWLGVSRYEQTAVEEERLVAETIAHFLKAMEVVK